MSGCRLGSGVQVEVVRWRAGWKQEVVRKKKGQRGLTPFYIIWVLGFVLGQRKEKEKWAWVVGFRIGFGFINNKGPVWF